MSERIKREIQKLGYESKLWRINGTEFMVGVRRQSGKCTEVNTIC